MESKVLRNGFPTPFEKEGKIALALTPLLFICSKHVCPSSLSLSLSLSGCNQKKERATGFSPAARALETSTSDSTLRSPPSDSGAVPRLQEKLGVVPFHQTRQYQIVMGRGGRPILLREEVEGLQDCLACATKTSQ